MLYLQPRSSPKTEHQRLDLPSASFLCLDSQDALQVVGAFGHLEGAGCKVRDTDHPAVALSCMVVQLLTLQQRLQSCNGDFIKQL